MAKIGFLVFCQKVFDGVLGKLMTPTGQVCPNVLKLGVVALFGHMIRLTKVGVLEKKLVVQSSSNLILVREGFEAL